MSHSPASKQEEPELLFPTSDKGSIINSHWIVPRGVTWQPVPLLLKKKFYNVCSKSVYTQDIRYDLLNAWYSRRTKTKVWTLCPFLELETITHGRSYRDKVWSWDERMDHLETAISRDPPHNQLPNADTIAYTSKILLKGPRYSCLLWDYAGA